MDVLTVILLLVIVILIINSKTGINQRFHELEFRIIELQNLLKKREQESRTVEKSKEITAEPAPFKHVEPPKPVEFNPPPFVERYKEVISDNAAYKPIQTPVPAEKKIERREPSFFERYPDLEKFIGENLVNKIGIAILVLAIGYFVKYAIDNNWIGPIGRVAIGIICGGVLIAFAHGIRNSYKAFSSVLVGGGLAVFYFTITLAFQQFHLFGQLAAFSILIIITVFAVALSLLYDKQELAVIALIGGFGSPFMISNGNANYNSLFIYLLILNAGLLIIAYYKAWRILNISSFVLSIIVFTVLLFSLSTTTYVIGFRYASIFYLLFFFINIINNVREKKAFLAIDFTILLVNTALYFAAGIYLLSAMGAGQFRGLFSAALAALNLLLSFILFRNRKVDPNIIYLLIGITLTFTSLTAPIQLHGNNITLFWGSEAALLYWLYQKSSIKLMKLTSLIVWIAMMISLFMDLTAVYSYHRVALTIVANRGFITTLFSSVSSYLLFILVKRDPVAEIYGIGIEKNIYRVVALILLFLSGLLEINYQFQYYYPTTDLNVLYMMLYVPVFIYLFNAISAKVNSIKFNGKIGEYLMISTAGVYLVCMPIFFDALRNILEDKKIDATHFTAHWISAIFIGLIFYQLIRICQDNFSNSTTKVAVWILSGTLALFLSLEFCLMSELIFYSKTNSIDLIQTVYVKTALPVLWGLLSFILMWIGMQNKQRILRIISLTLFTITLVKLFLFDINNIPVAGKIAAFFCLGVLLLIVSFMYQKVKKIIVNDEATQKD